jgi:hypothetical protein
VHAHVLSQTKFDANQDDMCECVIFCDGMCHDLILRHCGMFHWKWSVYTARFWEGMNFLVYHKMSFPWLCKISQGVDTNEVNNLMKDTPSLIILDLESLLLYSTHLGLGLPCDND